MPKCSQCGQNKGLFEMSHNGVCKRCETKLKQNEKEQNLEKNIAKAKSSGNWYDLPLEEVEKEAKSIILTTSFQVAGKEVLHELEIITAECVYGMNAFSDFFAGVRDVVGGRSKVSQKILRDARKTVLSELKREALMIGADAVIAVDLDYSEVTTVKIGGSGGMIMLVASGTAVKLK